MKKIYILLTGLLLFMAKGTFANEDPIKSNTKKDNGSLELKSTIQKEKNHAVNSMNIQNNSFVDKMDDLEMDVSTATENNRSDAQKTMSYLDQNPDKVKLSLSFEDLVTLPVGIKQKLGDNSEVTIIKNVKL